MERAIASLHLPYLAGCVVFTALFTTPGQLLAVYLDTRDFAEAIRVTQRISGQLGAPPTLEALAISQALYFALFVYIAYTIRYMRTKVVAAEPELLPLSPEGEELFHKLFGRISHARPPLLVGVIFFALSINFLQAGAQNLTGVASQIQTWASAIENAIVPGVWIWVYFAALRGLHSLGKAPLRLKSFTEDSMLGVRPVGSLSLSLALTFLGALGLGGPMLLFLTDPLSLGTFGGGITLGVVMFFLPLRTLHARMVQERQRMLTTLRARLTGLLAAPDNPGPEDASKALSRLTTVLTLQMARQDAANIPTWPFDTRILGRLSAIILSVIAIVLARVIGDFLL